MKTKVLLKKLAKFFPKSLAESYDHVGLQCGKIKEETNKILLCLDYDEDVYQYIIDNNLVKEIDLIISHHPFIFGTRAKVLKNDPLKKELYDKTVALDIPVYSYHTNFDSGNRGMNDALAKKLRGVLRDEEIDLDIPVVYASDIPLNNDRIVASSIFPPAVAGLYLAYYVIDNIIKK